MSEQTEELLIKEINGIGSVTAKKLRELDITHVEDLAAYEAHQLAEKANMSRDTSSKYIKLANTKLVEHGRVPKQVMTASELLQWRKSLLRCTTGSNDLDSLFDDGLGNNGIETSSIVEFFAEFGSGKSQIAHTMSVLCQLPPSENGLGANAIYIDTEGTFRPERLGQIASNRGLDPEKVLNNVLYIRAKSAINLEDEIQLLTKYVRESGTKLVVVDSITALHRAEYSGRGTLADRQQKLNEIVHKLLRVAEIQNLLVVITNQVQTSPDQMFGDPVKPVGGNVIAHTSTYRVKLTKSGRNRIAKMVDSPYHAQIDRRFTLNERGIDDIKEE